MVTKEDVDKARAEWDEKAAAAYAVAAFADDAAYDTAACCYDSHTNYGGQHG